MSGLGISIVIPVFDEVDNVAPLHARLTEVLRGLGRSYEILFVDDGSLDGTFERIAELAREDTAVRAIRFRRNFGKAAALAVAFREVRGETIVTMDGDLQDDPQEIPGLLAELERGYDLVSGWKRERRDPLSKTWPSRIWNRMTAWATGVRLHDFNCGFKVYRREVVDHLHLYGQLHRYIPVLADRLGFRVTERVVRHHPRHSGRSKYGVARFLNGFLDLLTVMFLGSSQRNPLHLFGRIGVAVLGVGLLIDAYMVVLWILEGALRVRPLLILGIVLLVVGIQFITMGLLAEMIASARRRDADYPIRERLP
ncbi:MAG: glycosyltransferase [Candidatus Eisenbacteria bacterium]|nr:glycosyltransferase [Candidatus Eisenbacteria bacterium]